MVILCKYLGKKSALLPRWKTVTAKRKYWLQNKCLITMPGKNLSKELAAYFCCHCSKYLTSIHSVGDIDLFTFCLICLRNNKFWCICLGQQGLISMSLQALSSMKAVFTGGFNFSNAESRPAMESASYMCKPEPSELFLQTVECAFILYHKRQSLTQCQINNNQSYLLTVSVNKYFIKVENVCIYQHLQLESLQILQCCITLIWHAASPWHCQTLLQLAGYPL